MKNVGKFLKAMTKKTKNQYEIHIEKHRQDKIPVIGKTPIVREFEILPMDEDDYASCRLKDLKTSSILYDGQVHNAVRNSNLFKPEQLIGKKVRLTTFAEIID